MEIETGEGGVHGRRGGGGEVGRWGGLESPIEESADEREEGRENGGAREPVLEADAHNTHTHTECVSKSS
jgi:hypothetical protein